MSLAGQRAVVTGGSNGIGYAICNLFMKEGAKVYILDLAGAGDAASKIGGGCVGIDCDVANEASVVDTFNKVSLTDACGCLVVPRILTLGYHIATDYVRGTR